MFTSIATVCLSGSLVEKLHACAAAGFDGVEIMDADLVAAYESPEEIRALCDRLGLRIDLFQPFRDFEGVEEDVFQDNLRRARHKFEIMNRLGVDMMLLCSNVGTATIPSFEVAAEQIGALADVALEYGVTIAYEALAWGRYVSDYRDAWKIVQLADRPNLGLCLDSFHVLSRGHDPSGIQEIDPDRLYFLQLADAPKLDMDILSWSRHHRLFPGEGEFDLTGFLSHVILAGYRGPISLEVFNDTFRQTDVMRTAEHALRSIRWVYDRTAALNGWDYLQLDEPQPPRGIDFAEIAGNDLGPVEQTLHQLGFAFGGRHRSKNVQLWQAGEANIILNERHRGGENGETPRMVGLGFTVGDARAAAKRAAAIGAPQIYRRTYEGEVELPAVAAPDGTEIFWNSHDSADSWESEFRGGTAALEGQHRLVGVIDHVNMAHPWDEFDEAVLFNTSSLALEALEATELPGLHGLVRSQVMHTEDRAVRIAMNMAPPTAPRLPQHIAVRVDDAIGAARAAKERGMRFLQIPANYYDDLAARFGLEDELLDVLRELNLLYDRDADGSFIHFYTPTIGEIFFEIVQRVGDYDGFGATSAPVRIAAQQQHDRR